MQTIPKIVPISDIRNNHKQVIAMATEQPIVLAQRSKSVAVLISIEQWDAMAKKMNDLETQLKKPELDSAMA